MCVSVMDVREEIEKQNEVKKNIKVPRMLIPCSVLQKAFPACSWCKSIIESVLKVVVILYDVAPPECFSHLSLLWRLSWDLAQESFIISAVFSHIFSAATQMHTPHHTANMSGSLVLLFLLHSIYISLLQYDIFKLVNQKEKRHNGWTSSQIIVF